MKIAIAIPAVPWPLNSGGNAAVVSTLKALEQDHEFHLIFPVYSSEDRKNVKLLRKFTKAAIHEVRLENTIQGWKQRLKPNIPSFLRQRLLPPHRIVFPFNPVHRKLAEATYEISKNCDILQTEFAPMLSLGACLPVKIPRIFVQHQIHYIYAKQMAENSASEIYNQYLVRSIREQEVALLQQYQKVIVFSDVDRTILAGRMNAQQISISPFALPADIKTDTSLSNNQFNGRFTFLASEGHLPNCDALDWLTTDIWPLIKRALPNASLSVIGKWSQYEQNRRKQAGVTFDGFAPDLKLALKASIMLVPLRIGSGLRVKIMAAMANSTPVISTSLGCEGMPFYHEQHLLVADKSQDFADNAVRMASEYDLRVKLSTAAKLVVLENYAAPAVRATRNKIYDQLITSSCL